MSSNSSANHEATGSREDWKGLYSDRETYASREVRARRSIETATGLRLLPQGLGAESGKTFYGYSHHHGGASGTADYQVDGAKVHVEVTGSRIPLKPTDALWVRPDKLTHAIASLRQGFVTYVAHETPVRGGEPLVRLIRLDRDALLRFHKKQWKTVQCSPKGKPESFVAIPFDDPAVLSLAEGCMDLWHYSVGERPPGATEAAPVVLEQPQNSQAPRSFAPMAHHDDAGAADAAWVELVAACNAVGGIQ